MLKGLGAAFGLVVIGVGGGAIIGGLINGAGEEAPMPAVFETTAGGLDAAIAEGRRLGRPVVAVAGASWCPPCQAMKRSTLADANVQQWLSKHAVPVYVDVDADGAAASALAVRSIPLTAVLVDGELVARREGFMSSDDYIAFLETATGGQ